MKVSIAISILILAVAAGFGWQGHQRLASARESHARLVAEAAALGITIDATGSDGKPLVTKHAEREDEEASAKQAAARLISFAKELEALEKQGGRNNEDTQKRIVDLMELMMSLNTSQLKTVIAEIRAAGDLKDDTRQGILGFTLMTLGEKQPQAVLSLLTESSDLSDDLNMGGHVVSSALNQWARNDPMGALEWVRKNGKQHPDLISDETKSALISGAAAKNPKLALQLIGELELKDSGRVISGITNTARTPEERTAMLAAVREHCSAVTDKAEREKLMSRAMTSLASTAVSDGFDSATTWISKVGFSTDELEKLSRNLPHNVKLGETGQWVEWVGETLPAGKADTGISRMVSNWTEKDYRAAGTWLASAADGPVKQTAVQSYAETVAPYDPQTAAQWALTLPPGDARQETLRRILQKWPEEDVAGADAFAKEHGIKK